MILIEVIYFSYKTNLIGYLENESLGTLERETPQNISESKFLGETPDSAPKEPQYDYV